MSSSDSHREKSTDEGTVKGDAAAASTKTPPGQHRFSRYVRSLVGLAPWSNPFQVRRSWDEESSTTEGFYR